MERNEKIEELKALLNEAGLDNFSRLMKLSRKYAKLNLQEAEAKKIAFLGTCSMQMIVSVTKLLLLRYDMIPEVYEGEYDGIKMDVWNDDSAFYAFAPDYVILLPDYRDVAPMPGMLATAKEVEECQSRAVDSWLKIYEKIHEKLPSCQILCSNFVIPFVNSLGNLEGNYLFSASSFYRQVNLGLIEKKPSYVTILDMEQLASYIGKSRWFDETAYFVSKAGFSYEFLGQYCDVIARQFMAILGKPKKCLVLDLDNTLWGGVVGDEGYDGIMLDPNDAIGEAYLAFQEYVMQLKDRGVILAVCSKNDFENAKEPFDKNEHMRIHYEDISCFVANWEDKVSNIRHISSSLNIGLDSLVFFDDNPTERELVRSFLPEVTTIEVPEDPAGYVRALDRAAVFDWLSLTKEDISRSQTYVDNRKREELMISCTDYEAYLEALGLEGNFEALNEKTIARFSQLINKSNQFNLRTRRYTEAEITAMMESDDYGLYTVSLKDKFSNYGVIACLVLQYQGGECFVDSWVMSCRVLKKDVEKYTMTKLLESAKARGCTKVVGEYLPTAKNGMVKELYQTFEFALTEEKEDGSRRFELTDMTKEYPYKIKENS